MGSTQSRVLITNAAIEDVRYCVFTPLNEEGREDLWWACPQQVFDEGVAFALGHEVWVMEWGNHADYVCAGLVAAGALQDDPESDPPPTPSEADDQPV